MTRTCTSRYGGHNAHCQDHMSGMHHAHTDTQCLMWVDSGVHHVGPIDACVWPPMHEANSEEY